MPEFYGEWLKSLSPEHKRAMWLYFEETPIGNILEDTMDIVGTAFPLEGA